MLILYSITAAALVITFFIKRNRTLRAFITAWNMFKKVFPSLLIMMIVSSVVLVCLPPERFSIFLRGDNPGSLLIAAAIGSITLVPGFIVFPLMGLLREQGASFMIISAFTTTLMMVGTVTFPVERACLGTKIALMRNLSGLIIALIVAFVTGLIFREIGV